MRTPEGNADLEPSDSPEAALEGDLATVTDDEYFEALAAMPVMTDADTGVPVDAAEGVRDERHHS
jgi:hypothetical protein